MLHMHLPTHAAGTRIYESDAGSMMLPCIHRGHVLTRVAQHSEHSLWVHTLKVGLKVHMAQVAMLVGHLEVIRQQSHSSRFFTAPWQHSTAACCADH